MKDSDEERRDSNSIEEDLVILGLVRLVGLRG
jgi:hypothetical protein